jgi:hypothetical protein
MGHFFSFRCPLVNTPQLNTQPNSITEILNSLTTESITCPSFITSEPIEQRSASPTVPLLFCVHPLLWKRVNFVATVWFSRVYNFQFSYRWKTRSVTRWFPRINLSAATHLPIRFLETAYMSQYLRVQRTAFPTPPVICEL